LKGDSAAIGMHVEIRNLRLLAIQFQINFACFASINRKTP
jgi:hypothetical protein